MTESAVGPFRDFQRFHDTSLIIKKKVMDFAECTASRSQHRPVLERAGPCGVYVLLTPLPAADFTCTSSGYDRIFAKC